MKKMLIWVFVLLIGASFVFAVEGDDWGDFVVTEEDYSDSGEESEEYDRENNECSSGCFVEFLGDDECDDECNNEACNWDDGDCEDLTDGPSDDTTTSRDDAATETVTSRDDSPRVGTIEGSSGAGGTEYTWEFYAALVVGLISLLIVGYVVYSIIKGPKNRWKKK